ncbi:ABC transporter permease [Piscinibacter sp.]|uniref:ABC transporter permease n=1 Tax=Piscinibacter sp. TaxID=1903157 RepID=UPI0025EEDF81|nr:ABC transporter permease [Piscinibacter sp.]
MNAAAPSTPPPSPLPALLRQVSWPWLLHQPLRHAVAMLAVALGVALAFSVHLINESALGEFSAAVRQVNGQPDFELRAQREGFDEALFARVATQPGVALASAVIELDAQALDASGQPVPLRVIGLDALAAAALTPALLPRPAEGADRLAVIDPAAAFLNAAAARRLGEPAMLRLRAARGSTSFAVRGSVLADGPPLAVLDLAGAQQAFGWTGRVSRIDVRLVPGTDREALLRALQLPAGVRAAAPDESAQRVSNVSRAYRVNLTVLALVALFTGAFLVFSILSLSVARRAPQLALLGVLGLGARDRLAWMLAESALIGLAGSVLGLALGTGLAALALRLLAGDLGGAYFPGVAPRLQFSTTAALVYGALGVAVAVAGGWLPARSAQRIAPAQALKGLGESHPQHSPAWLGPLLLALGVLLAQVPPVAGIPLAAYASVACLLLGGIACVPAAVALLLRRTRSPRHALVLLAVQRARHERSSATIAVSGVVASLALAVALTVMVTSFREAVTQWLDDVLPADLYARAAAGGGNDTAWVDDALVAQLRALPGVARVEGQRVAAIQLDASRPTVALVAKRVADDPARRLPLLGELLPAREGLLSVYVSEPAASLYGLRAGARFELPLPDGQRERAFVRAVWRDYARQHGAVTLDAADYRRLTGDLRLNDLALWLAPGADAAAVQAQVRALAGPDAPLEFATVGELRALSLRIFDRSFAVTYWLQAVAIAIGLAGIAASFSAQVLARRREFGLLAHLGLTRAQVLAVVAGEGALWSGVGVLLGLALGIAVSAVLVHVVNPQSFHWTMELRLPWARLALLAAAMAAAGTLTAWWAGRAAGAKQAALAVKEDW